jgi:hypothetical protein
MEMVSAKQSYPHNTVITTNGTNGTLIINFSILLRRASPFHIMRMGASSKPPPEVISMTDHHYHHIEGHLPYTVNNKSDGSTVC